MRQFLLWALPASVIVTASELLSPRDAAGVFFAIRSSEPQAPPAPEPAIRRRSAHPSEIFRRQFTCSAGNTYCLLSGGCCPTLGGCCSTNGCRPDGATCCVNTSGGGYICQSGETCCLNSCMPVGSNCCLDGSHCPSGNACSAASDGKIQCTPIGGGQAPARPTTTITPVTTPAPTTPAAVSLTTYTQTIYYTFYYYYWTYITSIGAATVASSLTTVSKVVTAVASNEPQAKSSFDSLSSQFSPPQSATVLAASTGQTRSAATPPSTNPGTTASATSVIVPASTMPAGSSPTTVAASTPTTVSTSEAFRITSGGNMLVALLITTVLILLRTF